MNNEGGRKKWKGSFTNDIQHTQNKELNLQFLDFHSYCCFKMLFSYERNLSTTPKMRRILCQSQNTSQLHVFCTKISEAKFASVHVLNTETLKTHREYIFNSCIKKRKGKKIRNMKKRA